MCWEHERHVGKENSNLGVDIIPFFPSAPPCVCIRPQGNGG